MRVPRAAAQTPTSGPGRRALIVSTGRDRGALAGARSLRESGWVVGVGSPEGAGMVSASNACHRSHVVPRPRGHEGAFVAGVREAVAAGGYQVVFGGGDDWARHAGLGTPHTVRATPEALDRWRGPVVVKCRTHWSPDQVRWHRIDARLFPDVTSARSQVEHITAAGADPVLQEPVDGRLGALVGLFHEGRLHGRVQQVTSALWPTPSGMSSRARTVPVQEDLVASAKELLRRVGWWGLVDDVWETLRHGWGAHHSVWDARDAGPTLRLIRERISALPPRAHEPLVPQTDVRD